MTNFLFVSNNIISLKGRWTSLKTQMWHHKGFVPRCDTYLVSREIIFRGIKPEQNETADWAVAVLLLFQG
jgi:hypothetical protein